MTWVCDSCRTENPPSAAFCSMCKKVPRASGGSSRSSVAAPPVPSGLELALPERPATLRASRKPSPIAPRAFTSGRFARVSIAQEGPVLSVIWGPSIGGRVRFLFLLGLGVLFLWGAKVAAKDPELQSGDAIARLGWWALLGLGVFVAVISLWRLGAAVAHHFDSDTRQVVRARSYFGVPLGSRTFRLLPGGRVEVVAREHRSRSGATYSFTVRAETASGHTVVLVTDEEAGAAIVADDVRTHLRV